MRRVILAICATAAALVLLLTFKSHAQSPVPGSAQAGVIGTPTPGSSGAVSTAAPASSGTAAANGSTRTVTGAAWPTVYGPVQVRVTVTGGRVTAVSAVEYPTGTPRDVQINQFAIPELNSEALKAGSAQIDTVSGATYTSQGYIGSLQNALDQVRLSLVAPPPGHPAALLAARHDRVIHRVDVHPVLEGVFPVYANMPSALPGPVVVPAGQGQGDDDDAADDAEKDHDSPDSFALLVQRYKFHLAPSPAARAHPGLIERLRLPPGGRGFTVSP